MAQKELQLNVSAKGLRTSLQNGTKVEISPEGDVTVYTEGGVEAKPGVSGEAAQAQQISIAENFNAVSMFGAKVELAKNGNVIVHTDGTVKIKLPVAEKVKIPKLGTVMEDGTIFAGISPDTNKPMYAAPADESRPMNFNKAAKRASELSKETGKAYRVPSAAELGVLFNNRAAIGGFKQKDVGIDSFYHSSTPTRLSGARMQNFEDGNKRTVWKSADLSVRLVRS